MLLHCEGSVRLWEKRLRATALQDASPTAIHSGFSARFWSAPDLRRFSVFWRILDVSKTSLPYLNPENWTEVQHSKTLRKNQIRW